MVGGPGGQTTLLSHDHGFDNFKTNAKTTKNILIVLFRHDHSALQHGVQHPGGVHTRQESPLVPKYHLRRASSGRQKEKYSILSSNY